MKEGVFLLLILKKWHSGVVKSSIFMGCLISFVIQRQFYKLHPSSFPTCGTGIIQKVASLKVCEDEMLSVSIQAHSEHSTGLFHHHHHQLHNHLDLFSRRKVTLNPGHWQNYSINHQTHFPVRYSSCSYSVSNLLRRKYTLRLVPLY